MVVQLASPWLSDPRRRDWLLTTELCKSRKTNHSHHIPLKVGSGSSFVFSVARICGPSAIAVWRICTDATDGDLPLGHEQWCEHRWVRAGVWYQHGSEYTPLLLTPLGLDCRESRHRTQTNPSRFQSLNLAGDLSLSPSRSHAGVSKTPYLTSLEEAGV